VANRVKIYTVKFETRQAERNLKNLERVLDKIGDSKALTMVGSIEKALKRLDTTAKSAGRSLKTVAGRRVQQNMEKLEKSVKRTGNSFKRISLFRLQARPLRPSNLPAILMLALQTFRL
jgi:hypothetical protein